MSRQFSLIHSFTFSTARNASCGISTRPTFFIRFLPSFCFSSSVRLRGCLETEPRSRNFRLLVRRLAQVGGKCPPPSTIAKQRDGGRPRGIAPAAEARAVAENGYRLHPRLAYHEVCQNWSWAVMEALPWRARFKDWPPKDFLA